MARQIVSFTLFIVILAQYYSANATHIYGGDLLYEYLSDNTYKVTLTIYGDCSGSAFPTLANARPTVRLMRGTASSPTRILRLEKDPGTGIEVTPVCPADSDKTACKSAVATLPGITQYIYSATVDILSPYHDWVFIFDGNTSPGSAGRTNSIGNIYITNMGSLMYLEAHLNNMNGPNSSPKYINIPTPFYCVNKPQEYNQGAIDPDNDSLYFLLTPALETSVNTVSYVPPYTGANPIATTGAFNYNNLNGQMSFTPGIKQVSIVANKILEYKNGVLVGSSMREMTFIVLDNCTNSAPVGKIDSNVVGGSTAPGNTVNVCQGTEYVSFKVKPADADNNNISITNSKITFGGVLNISNNNTPQPLVEFYWSPDTAQPLGAYTFFLNYKDDGCPLSSNQTVAYTIRVVKPMKARHELLFPTECAHNAYARFIVEGGAKPRVVRVKAGNHIAASYSDSNSTDNTDSAYIFADSFKKGTYDVLVYSPYLRCSTTYTMVIPDSGTYPFPPAYDDVNTCLNAPVQPIRLRIDTSVLRLNWYDMEDIKFHGPPVYHTDTVKTFSWQISQTHGNCESDKVPFNAIVHELPVAEILTQPVKVCIGDEVRLLAAGGETYRWLPEDKMYGNAANYSYAKVMTPTTYFAIAQSKYGCLDTADITYSDIEQCCTFSYPNAFTPNGDGMNDGFRALLYGNASEYHFSIYNRWGQRVFFTDNPKQAWDGTFNGKPCEMGVYFYRVKGVCLTGHHEENGGDVMLLR